MDDVWTVTPARPAGTHEVTLRDGPPRPLVARLTDAGLVRVESVLPAVADAVRRGEFSRIQLGAAFREAIGRDPFRQKQATGARRPGLWPAWLDIAYLVIFVGALTGDHAVWLRVVAGVLAAITIADLAGHGWRRLRRSAFR